MKHALRLVLALFCAAGLAAPALAANPAVYEKSVRMPLAQAVKAMSAQLDQTGFSVVNELHVSKSIARLAGSWGDEYNRNHLEGITALVFCSASYANKVSNLDPTLLGICPLHLTLIHKAGVTTVLFNRPTFIASGSPALGVLRDLEDEVTTAIDSALETAP